MPFDTERRKARNARWLAKPGNAEKKAEYQRRYREANRERQRAASRKSYYSDVELSRKRALEYAVKKAYGICLSEREQLLAEQGNVCTITGRAIRFAGTGFGNAAVDHCHASGRIRGIIAQDINLALGKFQDNPEWLRKAADYIEKHRARQQTAA